MRIAGLDIGLSATSRTNALALFIDGTLTVKRMNVDERNAALRALPPLDVLAIDAPLLPPHATAATKREVEQTFSRGAFQTRCKPGFSHVPGTGQSLRAHGAEAAANAAHALRRARMTLPRVLPDLDVVEAFPNAFLGVLVSDDAYLSASRQKRGSKFDWLYDQCAPLFPELLNAAGLSFEMLSRFENERDHEHRAALICLLTAAFGHNGTATVVGDPQGGYFFMPPRHLWETWALDALTGTKAARGEPRTSSTSNVLEFAPAADLQHSSFAGDPLAQAMEPLINEHSVPEVIESLINIARHYKLEMQAEGNGEWQSWEGIEQELTHALRRIEGD